jgi:GrpB-like predicted nucleotidyltransferase (UPF0157 family)/GNAT superfamily N-acetyltransferase
MSKTKNIEIFPYNPRWPYMFEAEAAHIKQALGCNLLEIHHSGSTSVPGLSAKPKIDMLAVVKNSFLAIPQLETIGLKYKGEYNIPLHYGFSKRGGVKVNLHVYEAGHPEIEWNLIFRDYLRAYSKLRDAYAQIKKELVQDASSFHKENSPFTNYTLRKGDFIRSVLKAAGFSRIRILKCSDETEWKAAQHFRDKYFFEPQGIEDPYTWTFHHEEHAHLILYQGAEIIGYAHIQFWPNKRAAMRMIVVQENKRNQSLGSQFLAFIEKWLKASGISSIHVESRPSAVKFYLKHAYIEMPFEDPVCLSKASVDDSLSHEPTPISKDIALGKIVSDTNTHSYCNVF